MKNRLMNETSPYLLQHADNPVDWYPWCEEAFERARKEDKPIFLSIGYSTCHWCHVMAHESFEDETVAEVLNQNFIAIKVDKEERPDIDSIYMSVCQAFTGSGGWPTSIFMTPDQKPFYAGTYFPKNARYGQMGVIELLNAIIENWKSNREELLESAEEILSFVNRKSEEQGSINEQLIDKAVERYKRSFDQEFGGFGRAPKFPTPHNLLFLMRYYEKSKDETVMKMVEKTLMQMYRGGLFDHIGGGFCRYSTDRYFLVPHFEKMLYDNALLILAYAKAYQITGKLLFREVAEKTASYILREMTSPEGGFYCAQDADSEGAEGKYYLFEPDEIFEILGEQEGKKFNQYFDITESGNFGGKNILNLLKNEDYSDAFDSDLSAVYEYRKKRFTLHLDDKILTSWNALMITAMCYLYRVSQNRRYLEAAIKAQKFISEKLCERNRLYVSYRNGKHGGKGFLDDYANEILALLALYHTTFHKEYLHQALQFSQQVISEFSDDSQGGFFLSGKENEQLILRPKETYDGAVFSGNSAMAYNFVQLNFLTGESKYQKLAEKQLSFMSSEAEEYPNGYAMFLMALSDYIDMPDKIIVVLKDSKELKNLSCRIPLDTVVEILEKATEDYSLINDRTTFYVCKGRTCKQPVNYLKEKC